MKKTAIYLSLLFFIAGSSSAQDFGASSRSHLFQAALTPSIQLIPYNQDIAGLRLNGEGLNRNMTGLDIGFFNLTDENFRGIGLGIANLARGNASGIHIGFINYVEQDMTGFQGVPLLTLWNAVNIVGGQSTGFQNGLYNQSEGILGLQSGLINVGYNTTGVQLGLYNYTEQVGGIQLGIANIAFDDAYGVQIGIYNGTRSFRGLQVGLVNQTQTLNGLQIGLVNIASSKEQLPFTVLANWQF